MPFPILGTPKPAFFDSSGSPLVAGTLSVLDPADDTNKASYPTYDDAAVPQNANTNPIVLDARGEPTGAAVGLWGLDGEDYKLVLKDSNGDTIWTMDDIQVPIALPYGLTAAESSAGVTPTNYSYEPGNVLRYGTNTTPGTTDMATAVTNAFASNDHVVFPDGTYRMDSGITKLASNVKVEFGSAIIQNGGAGFLFTFGATADTPTYTGLDISGGYFEQITPATTSNYNYIKVAATKDFTIKNVNMKNVSNGGIYVEAGCEDGVIDNITVDGSSGNSTVRGIWLDGSSASDYASQLIDISTLARNATAVPAYAVKNVKITNCTVDVTDASNSVYGIYLINCRNVKITNNLVDISPAGSRCLGVNNYSPDTIISGNTFIAGDPATGILITQFSENCKVYGNTFEGSFGSGRDVYVQYMGQAEIFGNVFDTDSTQQIQIDSNGTAHIHGNKFLRPSGYQANHRVCEITNIDDAVDGTSTYGDTATTLQGVIFENNEVFIRMVPVRCRQLASTASNYPGFEYIIVRNNVFNDFDGGSASDEYGLNMNASGSTYKLNYLYEGNIMLPTSEDSVHNIARIQAGTGYNNLAADVNQTYTTGAHAALRDFTGTTTAAEALQLLETLVDDLKNKGIIDDGN